MWVTRCWNTCAPGAVVGRFEEADDSVCWSRKYEILDMRLKFVEPVGQEFIRFFGHVGIHIRSKRAMSFIDSLYLSV